MDLEFVGEVLCPVPTGLFVDVPLEYVVSMLQQLVAISLLLGH
jgi:hypothetical protein